MDVERYQRRPFFVEAVVVTPENMAEVSTWCDGTIVVEDATSYIKVPVKRPMHIRQTYAYPGHYVVKAGTGFKVYTPKRFEADFHSVNQVDLDEIDLVLTKLETIIKNNITNP